MLNGATTPAGNGTAPVGEINVLADILAACVNSNGAVAGPASATNCYTLFTNAPDGATLPSDTATAAINIAHHPAANVAALFSLVTPVAPYLPVLATAPNDYTIAIRYTGAGLATSTAEIDQTVFAVNNIAVDSAGNIWKPNCAANTMTQLSPSAPRSLASAASRAAASITPSTLP